MLKKSENQDDFQKSVFFDLQKCVICTSKKSSKKSSFNSEIIFVPSILFLGENKIEGTPIIKLDLVNPTWVRFIYILDSSNSSSITFWTSQFGSSSRSNWTGIWTGNSNGSWTDKQSSHFSTAKEMSAKATFFFM